MIEVLSEPDPHGCADRAALSTRRSRQRTNAERLPQVWLGPSSWPPRPFHPCHPFHSCRSCRRGRRRPGRRRRGERSECLRATQLGRRPQGDPDWRCLCQRWVGWTRRLEPQRHRTGWRRHKEELNEASCFPFSTVRWRSAFPRLPARVDNTPRFGKFAGPPSQSIASTTTNNCPTQVLPPRRR